MCLSMFSNYICLEHHNRWVDATYCTIYIIVRHTCTYINMFLLQSTQKPSHLNMYLIHSVHRDSETYLCIYFSYNHPRNLVIQIAAEEVFWVWSWDPHSIARHQIISEKLKHYRFSRSLRTHYTISRFFTENIYIYKQIPLKHHQKRWCLNPPEKIANLSISMSTFPIPPSLRPHQCGTVCVSEAWPNRSTKSSRSSSVKLGDTPEGWEHSMENKGNLMQFIPMDKVWFFVFCVLFCIWKYRTGDTHIDGYNPLASW